MTKKKEKRKKELNKKFPPSEQNIFRTSMLIKINVTSTIINMKN